MDTKVGLTENQVTTLVVLIGMHQEFGLLLRKLRKNPALSHNYYDYFIKRLEHFVVPKQGITMVFQMKKLYV